MAQAKLGGDSSRDQVSAVETRIPRATKPTNVAIDRRTTASKRVSSLKCDGTPRHLCSVIRAVSETLDTAKLPLNSHPHTRPMRTESITQAIARQNTPNGNPNKTSW